MWSVLPVRAESGNYHNHNAPLNVRDHLRPPVDCATDDSQTHVVVGCSSNTARSKVVLNALALIMPTKKKKRQSQAAGVDTVKRARGGTDVRPHREVDGIVVPAPANQYSSSSSSLSSSSAPVSSSATSFASASSSSRPHTSWHDLPLELLLLIADFVPTHQLLLPLSSTNRRFYELIHEETTSGVTHSSNSIHELAVRVSCWHHHAPVHVLIDDTDAVVDSKVFSLEDHDASFMSRVLTSLRNVPHLEFAYSCPGGPHASNLAPLRHFHHLRSLTLLLGGEDATRRHNLAANLSTALLSLPSLVSLTISHCDDTHTDALLVEPRTLQRLVDERLLHLSVGRLQYEQLTNAANCIGPRKRDKRPPFVYPRIVSVTLSDSYPPPLSKWLPVFPTVQHVTLSDNAELDIEETSRKSGLDTLFRLVSLQLREIHCQRWLAALKEGHVCRVRCLSLRRSDFREPNGNTTISEVLSLMPTLTQLAITGNCIEYEASDAPSLFGMRAGLLPELTYLQNNFWLNLADIALILSPHSPPAFAASLTHLALCVRWSDWPAVAALATVYPNLQRCHVEVQHYGDVDMTKWHTAIAVLRQQLGSVWCDSSDDVREARLDVEWRRSAGLPPVSDESLGRIVSPAMCVIRDVHRKHIYMRMRRQQMQGQ